MNRRDVIADEGVPAAAVDGQQAPAPPQLDDMEVPAEAPVRLGAIGRRLLLQKPLEGKGQSQFHHAVSWGMTIFSTWSFPSSASAIIMVIS